MLNYTFKIVSLINDVLNVKLKVLEKLSNILYMTCHCMSDVTAASHSWNLTKQDIIKKVRWKQEV